MSRSEPLQVLDWGRPGKPGKGVLVQCVEPASCLRAELHGQSVAVNAAIERLEAIHQAAHALREEA